MAQISIPSYSSSRTKTRTYDLKADPSAILAAMTQLLCPTGTIIPSLSGTEPGDGWKLLNGQTLLKFEWPALYACLAGNVAETTDSFTLPDLRGKMLIGEGGAPALAAFATTGAHQISLSVDQLPSHSHGVSDPGHAHSFAGTPHSHGITDPGHAHTATTVQAAQTATGIDKAQPAAGATTTDTTGITVDAATAGGTVGSNTTGITVLAAGSGQAVPILPPVMAIHWMVRT